MTENELDFYTKTGIPFEEYLKHIGEIPSKEYLQAFLDARRRQLREREEVRQLDRTRLSEERQSRRD